MGIDGEIHGNFCGDTRPGQLSQNREVENHSITIYFSWEDPRNFDAIFPVRFLLVRKPGWVSTHLSWI